MARMKAKQLIGLIALSLIACDRAPTQAAATEPDPGVEPAAHAATAPAPAEKGAPQQDTDSHAGLASYDVSEVEALLSKKEATAVDANSADTRDEYGMLPGAVLLSSSSDFGMTELPADKRTNLVFYCGSEKCSAAPKAAKRARAAGYENVHVMPAGIRGWVKAGKKVDRPS
jgi:rhodanese-related sulfurtransferase